MSTGVDDDAELFGIDDSMMGEKMLIFVPVGDFDDVGIGLSFEFGGITVEKVGG